MSDPHWTIDGRDAYDILGVDHTASQDEIRRAYRQLSRRHHPDAGGRGDEQTRLNLAYRTLSDPRRRANHDHARQREPPAPPEPAFQWSYGTGPTDPPRTDKPPPASAATEPAEPTEPTEPAARSPEAGRLESAFLGSYLATGVGATLGIGAVADWHAGLIVLVWLMFLLGSMVFIGVVEEAPQPRTVVLPLGVGLIAGLLASPTASVWLGRLSGGHAGITVVVWLATTAACLAYVSTAIGFSEARTGGKKATWCSGLVLLTVLAGFLAAVAWIGELSGWHSGIILTMWVGELFTVVSYAIAAIGPTADPRRPARTALTSSLLPVGVFGLGIAVTVWFGTSSGWHAGIILAFWAAVSLVTFLYAGFRAAQADAAEAAR